MKNLSFIDKFIFLINSIIGIITLGAYALPYLPPRAYSLASVISLTTPLLLTLNFVFILYWVIRLKKHFLLSLLILAIGYQYINALVQFNEKKVFLNDDIKIMSYNVRLFNHLEWSKKDSLDIKIVDFINSKNLDILCIQEYSNRKKIKKIDFPYSYIQRSVSSKRSLQAIYSKYRIINRGSLNFVNSGNNCIYIDIVKNKDTLRIYNLHLQSLSLDKNKDNFGQKNSEVLLHKFKSTFKRQEVQTDLVIKSLEECPFKSVLLGDFNNTAFSWVYRQLKKNKKDAFLEAGSGVGKTFDYIFPFRIDFILTDKNIQINNYRNYRVDYSDHYPIMCRINLNN